MNNDTRRSAALVHPSLRAAIAALPDLDIRAETLDATRRMIAARFAAAPLGSDADVLVETLNIESAAGNKLRVLAYRPQQTAKTVPAILHLHGGGFMMGMPELADAQHRMLVRSCGVAVYSLDYRLAPETAYPGQLEDAVAALEWLHANAEALGIDRSGIGLKGESAGGGLALALALRERISVPVAFQLLTFPALDDRTGSTIDPHPYCGEFLWTAALNRLAWTSLLGREPGGPDTPALAAPARALDLSGLPPTFLAVGALDLYLEENLEFARRLSRAGVPIKLHVYPGAVHGFGMVPESWIHATTERDLREATLRFVRSGGWLCAEAT